MGKILQATEVDKLIELCNENFVKLQKENETEFVAYLTKCVLQIIPVVRICSDYFQILL